MNTAPDSATVTDADAQDWLTIGRVNGRSQKTLDLYAIVARQLTEFFGKPLRDVTKADAVRWLEDAKSRWQDGGIHSRLKSIRALYNWMVEEEIIAKSPWKGLSIKLPNAPQLTATDDDLRRMLDGADRQEACLILTLADTGMRKDECANLEFRDVNVHGGTIDIRISKSRPRTVPMSDALVKAMMRWLRERGTAEGSLWKPKREAADNYSHIRSTLHRRSGGTVTPHSLRRKFCVDWLISGDRSEASLARLMSWSDTTQVAVYIRAAADEVAASEYHRFKKSNAA